MYNGQPIGITDPALDPEVGGDLMGPLDGELDLVSGHGTFIAGIIRQACPQAEILSTQVTYSDGAVLEDELLLCLQQLAVLAQDAAAGAGGQPLDVISLSVGYYHETPSDALTDGILAATFAALGEVGVTVVAAAGNDATTRPCFPAALALSPSPGPVPVASVGALNPASTVAAFSNSGKWVTIWEVGANVVSSLPVTFQGGEQADTGLTDPSGRRRESLDPDNFHGGFGLWSGTSFAAPAVAGRIAAELLSASEAGTYPLDDAAVAVDRARAALAAVAGGKA